MALLMFSAGISDKDVLSKAAPAAVAEASAAPVSTVDIEVRLGIEHILFYKYHFLSFSIGGVF
jgi:hypothetical protein